MNLLPRQRRAVIVEDDDNIATAICFILSREGFACERLADGTGAAARIRSLDPDLVLLDVMLPGRSGYDICRALRADPVTVATPILMMSASGAPAAARSRETGANGFLAKPFAMTHLRAELRRLLADPVAPAP